MVYLLHIQLHERYCIASWVFKFPHPALEVDLCTERHQRLDAFHLSDAVVALLNQLRWKERKVQGEFRKLRSCPKTHQSVGF